MKKVLKYISMFILCFLIVVATCSCNKKKNKLYETMEDLKNAEIGVLTGSSFNVLADEYLPDAKKVYLNNISDLILNLKQSKIDGILMDKAFYTPLRWDDKSLGYIEMEMPLTKYAVAFPKQNSSIYLKDQVNEFIASSKENGLMDKLTSKWFGENEPDTNLDTSHLTGENGTIKVATAAESKPLNYLHNNECTGFDIELIIKFAEAYGYKVEIDYIDFNSIVPSLSANRYDLAISSITITEEREESVMFSDAYYESSIIMALLKENIKNYRRTSLDEFNDATLGIMTGSIYETIANERYPNAEQKHYSLLTDLFIAVNQGKVDGFITEIPYYTSAKWEGSNIDKIDEILDQTNAGFILNKDESSDKLLNELNTFLKKSKEEGLLLELKDKWFSDTEPTEFFDFDQLTGENGTIKVAVAPDLKPYIYVKNGKDAGYEMEILGLFAKEYGYDLDVDYMAFSAILPCVISGMYDIAAGGFTITEERKESVNFSESHITVDVIMVTAGSDEIVQENIFQKIASGFDKTFIREDRWKLIVEGMLITILISICSVVCGTLFGFGIYLLSRSSIKWIRKITNGFGKVYTRIVNGTPVVVILMILFYVVFGSLKDINGVLVAIIGFSFTFGAFVYDHMKVSVDSVNYGQTEAAYALGYTKSKAFFRILLPQSMSIFYPTYIGHAVELIKATAVVGYIAVTDLTKMSDIIRSNTYEAFFPLITTALIYFILTWLLTILLKYIYRVFDFKKRSGDKILKGVSK